MSDGTKYDPAHIPWDAIEDLARFMEAGAETRGFRNWETLGTNEFIKAIGRHYIEMMAEVVRGKDLRGTDHLQAIAANALILLSKTQAKSDAKSK